jgi:hypothetical protein
MRSSVVATFWGLGALAFSTVISPAASFEEQRKVVAAAVENQPEEAILSLLQAGIDECQPAQASALASQWLRNSQP